MFPGRAVQPKNHEKCAKRFRKRNAKPSAENCSGAKYVIMVMVILIDDLQYALNEIKHLPC